MEEYAVMRDRQSRIYATIKSLQNLGGRKKCGVKKIIQQLQLATTIYNIIDRIKARERERESNCN